MAEHDAICMILDDYDISRVSDAWKTKLRAARAQLDALLSRQAKLEAVLRDLSGVVNALDIVCASKQLTRKLRDALAGVRDEVSDIGRRALEPLAPPAARE